ncbi:dihydrodipicolinate synthase family protein [Streptomyces albipurpureus]|uniref:Dihydrodipicolinate synthase family protein n=1 Tax=Streptomyces albipurpureus TaxID=2897419 RepID=A0ABT0UU60_9ACTN|nr:dihydrodipicolinate synthase family protein [Streptomyces sp. CWNU-1]MCM2392122.1 dihydrodipicolinate synthase family protein [Streptomyces sp. CWNU-1]
MSLVLPDAKGRLRTYVPRPEPADFTRPARPDPPTSAPAPATSRLPAGTPAPFASRTVFAAAHVVAAPYADNGPGAPAVVDWDATLAFRRHLWSYGLGVAEAMDTAQRGAGLDWPAAAELIRRSAAEASAVGGRIVCGVGTDQLPPGPASLDAVRAAYEEQLTAVEEVGAQAVLMASRALAAAARGPEDYLALYTELLRQAREPVVLHWLGPMFDPALRGYWGSDDLDAASAVLLEIIAADPAQVDGVKVSLLDAGREIALRRALPRGVRCYTGDDFHYPELIAGDEQGFSHALLGVLDPLGPLAADAVRRLDQGDTAGFRTRLDPARPLSRHLFEPPTHCYKTGVVLLAWLAGHQTHFTMVGGTQSARSLPHLARAYELADGLGLFPDPELAETRMRSLLGVYGIDG